jgi:hypothetical protein
MWYKQVRCTHSNPAQFSWAVTTWCSGGWCLIPWQTSTNIWKDLPHPFSGLNSIQRQYILPKCWDIVLSAIRDSYFINLSCISWMHIGSFKFKMHLIIINDNASIDARKTCRFTTIMLPSCLLLNGYGHEALNFVREVSSLDLGQDNDYLWLLCGFPHFLGKIPV